MNLKNIIILYFITNIISSTIRNDELLEVEKENQNKDQLKPNPWYVYWCPDCCICGPYFNHDELIEQKKEINIKKSPKFYILMFETALTTLVRCSLLSFKHIKAKKYKNFFENIFKNEVSIFSIKMLFSVITGQNRTYFRYIFFFCSLLYFCIGQTIPMAITILVFAFVRIFGYPTLDNIAAKLSFNNIVIKSLINGVFTYFLEVYCAIGEMALSQIIGKKIKRF